MRDLMEKFGEVFDVIMKDYKPKTVSQLFQRCCFLSVEHEDSKIIMDYYFDYRRTVLN